MADILITGGAGSFGRTLASALRQEGHHLRIFDLPSCDFTLFSGWEETKVFTGDILEPGSLKDALENADMIFHLAAILPPISEADKERTFKVNVEGTKSLVTACESLAGTPRIIFASSVSVYGDTSSEQGVIGPGRPVNPNSWYAESKVKAEAILAASGLPVSNLRISGVVIPAFLDPPEPWPFMSAQQIELLVLSDLITAMANLVGAKNAPEEPLLISGGPSWQVQGDQYVKRWGEVMEIPLEDMDFMDRPGWLSWYDTSTSQALLNYQNTSLDSFFKQLKVAVEEALA
jgi:UDP-glucose 4-epimerase